MIIQKNGFVKRIRKDYLHQGKTFMLNGLLDDLFAEFRIAVGRNVPGDAPRFVSVRHQLYFTNRMASVL